ncbi:hypothetical protein COY07_02415 [Candidatus Peregrinibacteria bacterium CG_4_10_14_0_2_um_filter_43_11]|nr:MAG: hypothetical protein COY07_02415 [Candidatus Peregrinibacteria bacterium CG_4_10_14_0_2_um_filter_43_11]
MIKTAYNRRLKLFLIIFSVLTLCTSVYADARDDFKQVLESRQEQVTSAYNQLDFRVKGMNSYDPKKNGAKDLLGKAKKAVDDFKKLDAGKQIDTLAKDVYDAKKEFKTAEENALSAINAVNLFLLSPARPGNVPEGDLVEDFAPQIIRLLFRFTSIAILISILVSAVMMITAMDNEERHTKAKQMLIFSLIGFAFVVLAFAIVKAVTDIDFFGFV